VGSHRANPFGLHDVHGNSKEWTRDRYGSYELPVKEGDGQRLVEATIERVARDGGGYQFPRYSTSASRSRETTSRSSGIRPARAIR
jgi:formylglycine-generating enzyme required for sulfatase activity